MAVCARRRCGAVAKHAAPHLRKYAIAGRKASLLKRRHRGTHAAPHLWDCAIAGRRASPLKRRHRGAQLLQQRIPKVEPQRLHARQAQVEHLAGCRGIACNLLARRRRLSCRRACSRGRAHAEVLCC
eukprot:237733-Chlamydomonas_euryale.AAC.4